MRENGPPPMPRTIIEPQFTIEHLSILDSDGNLDTALEPEISARRPQAPLSRHAARPASRRAHAAAAAPGTHRHLRAHQGPGGLPGRQRVPRCGRTDWMVPSFRETAAMLWRGWPIEKILLFFAGLPGGRPARARPARPPGLHPGRHPAPARGGPGLRRAVPRRRRGGDGVLRRRRHLRGRLPRGAELRRRLARAGGLRRARTTSGRSRSRSRSRRTRARSPRRRSPTASPASRWTATTCSRCTRRAARRWTGRARGDGPTLIECVTYRLGVHTTADDPDQVPLDRGGGGVGAQGPADPLPRLLAEAEPARARAGGGGGRGDRARRAAPSRRSARRDPLGDVRSRLRQPARRARRPARRDGGAARAASPRAATRAAAEPAHERQRRSMAKLNMVKALNLALLQEMERDPGRARDRRGRRRGRRRLPRHRGSPPQVRRQAGDRQPARRGRHHRRRRSAWRSTASSRSARSSSPASPSSASTRSRTMSRGTACAPRAASAARWWCACPSAAGCGRSSTTRRARSSSTPTSPGSRW